MVTSFLPVLRSEYCIVIYIDCSGTVSENMSDREGQGLSLIVKGPSNSSTRARLTAPWFEKYLNIPHTQCYLRMVAKERVKKEVKIQLGPRVREGEQVFGVAHIYASFNDTFVVRC